MLQKKKMSLFSIFQNSCFKALHLLVYRAESAHACAKMVLLAGNGKFCERKVSGCRKTKRFVFLKNRFNTSECTGSNQNKQKEQNIMVACAEIILESAKSFFLEQI